EVAGISGTGRVERIELVHRATGETRSIDCDTVVFTGEWIPDHELARAAELMMDAGTRGPRVDPAHRTSSPGVFAAGNLLHGAETAGIAALEGRAAARAIVRFLADGAWGVRGLVPVSVARPLVWISPNVLVPEGDPVVASGFVLRVGEFRRDQTIEVRQGTRILQREHFRALVPNRSFRLRGGWT